VVGGDLYEWASLAVSAYESALSGVIFMLLPNLKTLAMQTFERPRSMRLWRGDDRPRISQTRIKHFFGIRGGSNLQVSLVPDLVKLRDISFEDMIDWDFLRAETLESLTTAIDLSYPEATDIRVPQPATIPSVIIRVTLCVPAGILGNDGCSRTDYLNVLFKVSPALQEMKIALTRLYELRTFIDRIPSISNT
jgi:hypothetical protein